MLACALREDRHLPITSTYRRPWLAPFLARLTLLLALLGSSIVPQGMMRVAGNGFLDLVPCAAWPGSDALPIPSQHHHHADAAEDQPPGAEMSPCAIVNLIELAAPALPTGRAWFAGTLPIPVHAHPHEAFGPHHNQARAPPIVG